jgi:ATP-dependent DNA helicase RecG
MAVTSIFISSVQKELAEERRAVKAFVEGDPLLRRFFRVFLFEDLPAADRRADDVYLREMDRCGIYVGLFGNEYGFENDDGVSATEREFARATLKSKPRLIFVKGANDKTRHPKMAALVKKATGQLLRRRFGSTPELASALYASLVDHLELTGAVRTRPFDASAAENATLADISEPKLRWFLARARAVRRFALAEDTPVGTALQHLNLLDAGRPTHAAILLFGAAPQRFLTTSEVKCLHFHGTEIEKPIPSYQIYKGTVFDLVDQAVDFVMSKIGRSVGTRSKSNAAPVTYELPTDAVAEAIVNAVCHRDYASKTSVQVMLFADRLEVWNPGELPEPLTPELLRVPHASLPRNPLLAEPLFLARYIEKAGTGTLDMIRLMGAAGLPTPEFRQDGQFVLTLWRDEMTAARLDELGLNPRQRRAITAIKTERRLTNAGYQKLTGATRPTAQRDLEDLVKKGVLVATGAGRGSAYEAARKRLRNDSIGSSKPGRRNDSKTTQSTHATRPSASAKRKRARTRKKTR